MEHDAVLLDAGESADRMFTLEGQTPTGAARAALGPPALGHIGR
jgi:hypothetical protein